MLNKEEQDIIFNDAVDMGEELVVNDIDLEITFADHGIDLSHKDAKAIGQYLRSVVTETLYKIAKGEVEL